MPVWRTSDASDVPAVLEPKLSTHDVPLARFLEANVVRALARRAPPPRAMARHVPHALCAALYALTRQAPACALAGDTQAAIRADLDAILAWNAQERSGTNESVFQLGSDHNLIVAGDWSELLLFNGSQGWDAEHCAVAARTCRLVRPRPPLTLAPGHNTYYVTY